MRDPRASAFKWHDARGTPGSKSVSHGQNQQRAIRWNEHIVGQGCQFLAESWMSDCRDCPQTRRRIGRRRLAPIKYGDAANSGLEIDVPGPRNDVEINLTLADGKPFIEHDPRQGNWKKFQPSLAETKHAMKTGQHCRLVQQQSASRFQHCRTKPSHRSGSAVP